ncbi:Rab guanyl-nucleotide exchange factor [Aureococcus anophagefferens]|nr:Rab guanyl-nucleotide exchange factor [Aureococcus anophagefferens]
MVLMVDIACLLRNVVASSALDTARMTFDENNDGLVQFGEIARIFGELLRVRLLDGEIEALYDLLDNSLDHIRLVDLARFLDPRAAWRRRGRRAGPPRARARVDGRDARLYERRFPKQVGAVALGARGLAVGCFAPGHLDYVADLGAGGGEPAPGDAAWQAGRDVNALALFERAGELAVAAGDAVVIYAVAQRAALPLRGVGHGLGRRAARRRTTSSLAAGRRLGLDAALALGCVAAAALRGRGALSAAQYAAADLWVTFFYLLELVIRGICHVEVHHSLWKFARDPACVADGAVVALGLAAVFVRHAPYVSWGLA